MEAIKVEYTVRPEFVEENKANIRKVIDQLRAWPIDGLKYAAYTLEDGKTFVHLNVFRGQQALAEFQELEEFKGFVAALKASEPPVPAKAERMDLVGAGFEF